MLRQIFVCSARNYKLSQSTFPAVHLLQPPSILKRELHYWNGSKHQSNNFSNAINGKTCIISRRTFGIIPSRKDIKVKVAELGTVFVVFHLAMGLVWWGGLYVLILQGVDVSSMITLAEHAVDVSYWLEHFGYAADVFTDESASKGAAATIAFIIYKILSPVRMIIDLMLTPFVVKALRNIGILTPKVKIGDEAVDAAIDFVKERGISSYTQGIRSRHKIYDEERDTQVRRHSINKQKLMQYYKRWDKKSNLPSKYPLKYSGGKRSTTGWPAQKNNNSNNTTTNPDSESKPQDPK